MLEMNPSHRLVSFTPSKGEWHVLRRNLDETPIANPDRRS